MQPPASNLSAEEDNSAKPKDPSSPAMEGVEELQACPEETKEIEGEIPSECVSIPIEFAIKNVWPFIPTTSSCPDPAGEEGIPKPGSAPDHDIVFPSGLMAHARARFKDSFSDRAQLAALPETKRKGSCSTSKKQDLEDPVFTLFSPQKGLFIIDSFVRQIALSQEADVLVLDSIDLLGGQCSLLGKREDLYAYSNDWIFKSYLDSSTSELDEVMQKIYGTSHAIQSTKKSSRHDHIRHYLRALVALDLPTPLTDSKVAATPSDVSTATAEHMSSDKPKDNKTTPNFRRRIIYLRDFSAISLVAAPFIEELLDAIRLHRKGSNQDSAVVDPSRLQRVVLVMGVSRPLKTNSDRSRFESGGTELNKLLPHISSPKNGTENGANDSVLLTVFSRAYSVQERPASQISTGLILDWEHDANFIDLPDAFYGIQSSGNSRKKTLCGAVLAVFKPDFGHEWSEEAKMEQEERLLILNDLILREAIFAAGGFIERRNVFEAIFGTTVTTSRENAVIDQNDSASPNPPFQFLDDPRQQVLPASLAEGLAAYACGVAPSTYHSCFTSDTPSLSPPPCSVCIMEASPRCRVLVTPEIMLEAWNQMDALHAERRDFANVGGIQVSKLEEIKRGGNLNSYERQLLSSVVDPGVSHEPLMQL